MKHRSLKRYLDEKRLDLQEEMNGLYVKHFFEGLAKEQQESIQLEIYRVSSILDVLDEIYKICKERNKF